MKTAQLLFVLLLGILIGILLYTYWDITGGAFMMQASGLIVALGVAICIILIALFEYLKRNKGKLLKRLFEGEKKETPSPNEVIGNFINAVIKKEEQEIEAQTNKLVNLLNSLVNWYIFGNWTHKVILFLSTLIVGYLGIVLLDRQNKLFEMQNELFTTQNKRIDQQTNLEEANRRSSLVFLFANVLDKMDDELRDTIRNPKRKLSPQLIGRIAALSQSLKPYKYLEGDSLISKEISPERGQLLLAILKSDLDTGYTLKKIFKDVDFSSVELKGASMVRAYMRDIRLMDADLSGANLSRASLRVADLIGASLRVADLIEADLSGAVDSAKVFNNQFMSYLKENGVIGAEEIEAKYYISEAHEEFGFTFHYLLKKPPEPK